MHRVLVALAVIVGLTTWAQGSNDNCPTPTSGAKGDLPMPAGTGGKAPKKQSSGGGAAGVTSGRNQGKVSTTNASSKVKVEGGNVVRGSVIK